ncbi:hypothetical protein [Litorisediminicola beolgyonensis]|uniref:Uncharacterized protein n=1 Tax=Litorisediminicola beolgyonensis TaxID=1173614 RepID=A0ABW3ZN92_9RHOB
MTTVWTLQQRRDPDPDYSNEEVRAGLAERLLDNVPELIAMDAADGVVEACYRVGFNAFDCATLRLLAKRTGEFPLSIERREATATTRPEYTVRLGTASDALRTSRTENPDFWEDEALVEEAARRAPREWARIEAEVQREVRRIERAHRRARADV